jgi:DNA-binding NarL/FixJ family response regulator
MPVLTQRVVLVEDHPMFRRGLRRILEEAGGFQIVGEAQNGHEAIHQADVHQPDLIVIDVHLPGITGLKVARILRKQHERAKIVLLSLHLDDARVFEAIRFGAHAFLTKDVEPDDLVAALRKVIAGENLLHQLVLERPLLAGRVLVEFRSITDESEWATDALLPLSTREIEVLDCVAQGLSNKETARALFVTEQTIKNHMTSVLRKLDVNDRVQAVLIAVRHGWIELLPRQQLGARATAADWGHFDPSTAALGPHA